MKSVSATMNDEVVEIVEVNGNGNDIYITYRDNTSRLRFIRKVYDYTKNQGTIIASAASVNA